MSVATAAQRYLFPSVDRPGNFVRKLWDQLHALPGGSLVFSKLIGQAAPYSGTVDARVVELRRGHARTEMRDRRAVRNHLRCVHAIALVNLAEITGNIAVAYTLPDDARFIVAGLSIAYLKKARGLITGECSCPIIDRSDRKTYEIEVLLRDTSGEVVARATLQTLVGPKKG